MQTQAIHDLISETYTLDSQVDREVAQYLLCCVLEIAKCDGSKYMRATHSGYFWEKLEKALKTIGYEAVQNQHCIIEK
jgi:hypothetical protein